MLIVPPAGKGADPFEIPRGEVDRLPAFEDRRTKLYSSQTLFQILLELSLLKLMGFPDAKIARIAKRNQRCAILEQRR